MKIEVNTKYNIGDVLYYASPKGDIVKYTIKNICAYIEEKDVSIQYTFEDGDFITENDMDDFCNTLENAGAMIAKRAIENFKKEEISNR